MLSDERTPAGYATLRNCALVNSYILTNGKVIRSRKMNEMWDVQQGTDLSTIDLIMQQVMSSERKSPEWGVRALKGPFGCPTVPFPSDVYKRCGIIRLCCHFLTENAKGLSQ